MRNPAIPTSGPRGFTLIEALVALLILGFGMLAIAGFQSTLSRSADLAKQRTEATRLAQQKMESLRAYAKVDSDTSTPHIVNYTDDVVSSTAAEVFTTNTNAVFSRTWTVTAQANEKWINVKVAWTDRAGQPQEVQLLSVISKFDPKDIGTLTTFVPGAASNERRPKNRNINVPYPAVTLSDGTKSAFTPPPGNVIYVFDNTTGNIVQSCTPQPYSVTLSANGSAVTAQGTGGSNPFASGDTVAITNATPGTLNGTFPVTSASFTTPDIFSFSYASTVAAGTTSTATATKVVKLIEGIDLSGVSGLNCSTIDAYLLSGYVRFDTSNNPTGAEPATVGNNNATRALSSTPFSLDTSNQSTANGTPSMTCYAQQQKVVTANATAVNITSLSRSGNIVTVTAAGHGLVQGDQVAINAVNPAAFIGAFEVLSVPSSSTFTYRLTASSPSTGSGGTVTKLQRLTVPETTTVPGYTNVQARFVSYACVVTPVDHDNSGTTPKRWWGKVTLNTDGTWSVGTGSSAFKVCRYSADYNNDGTIANSEHPSWYRGVTGALDSQNYLVVAGNQPCPTDAPQSFGSPANLSDDTTALHQPGTSDLSFQCLNSSCSGGNKVTRELANTATDVPMD